MAEKASPTTIGQRIRSRRRELNLTLRELSERSDLSITYISDLERGKRGAPTAPVLERLATALECSVDYLLGREDPRDGEVIALNRGKLPPNLPPEALRELEEHLEYLEWKYGRGPKPKNRG